MQSYLFCGSSIKNIENKIESLLNEKKLKRMDFEIAKIDDVRALNRFTSLDRDGVGIVIKNIDKASEEALNAFLKNLEEPQDGLYYLITAASTKRVLPTILSRCQVVRVKSSVNLDNQKFKKFSDMDKLSKLNYLSDYKDRSDAIDFLNSLLIFYHEQIVNNKQDFAKNVDPTLIAISKLNANGNITLQLTNWVIELV